MSKTEWHWNHRNGNCCTSTCGRWVITVLHPHAHELWDTKERVVVGVFQSMAGAMAAVTTTGDTQ